MLGGAADGRPAIDTDAKLAEAILPFSGTTNGELAVQGFRTSRATGGQAAGRSRRRAPKRSASRSPTPRRARCRSSPSPEWSGSETGGRRYAPFTVNVERLKPWHTLTGRMHFFLDHDWMRDLGEALPIYRPPLDMHRLLGEPTLGTGRRPSRSRSATSRRTRSGRSTPSTRTTCSCCRSPAEGRRAG